MLLLCTFENFQCFQLQISITLLLISNMSWKELSQSKYKSIKNISYNAAKQDVKLIYKTKNMFFIGAGKYENLKKCFA